jgi:RHS repeat-associated protein
LKSRFWPLGNPIYSETAKPEKRSLYYAGTNNLQKWLNRDPIQESSGINLYGFAGNNPVSFVDILGLTTYWSSIPFRPDQLGTYGPYIENVNDGSHAIVYTSYTVDPEFFGGGGINSTDLDFLPVFLPEIPAVGDTMAVASRYISDLLGVLGDIFGCQTTEQTTLRLPATMTDELPAYQEAADQGLLIKTQSSALPPSDARAVWEAANGPVPDGFDVDHIIQRQHGGSDDLSNLQLKPSGLNRSEGSQAMWLNKSFPYGTVFDNVELTDPQ